MRIPTGIMNMPHCQLWDAGRIRRILPLHPNFTYKNGADYSAQPIRLRPECYSSLKWHNTHHEVTSHLTCSRLVRRTSTGSANLSPLEAIRPRRIITRKIAVGSRSRDRLVDSARLHGQLQPPPRTAPPNPAPRLIRAVEQKARCSQIQNL